MSVAESALSLLLLRGAPYSPVLLDRLKAVRARKLLQKKAALKEEKKAAALAAGLDWQSDESDDEPSVK